MIGLATCSNNLMAGPRATTNSICDITKKNNVFTTSVEVGNIAVLVPCGMVKHLLELRDLSKFMMVSQAIEFLIKKYDIPIPTKSKKHYTGGKPQSELGVNDPRSIRRGGGEGAG